jgi:pyrophosphatase PpaX
MFASNDKLILFDFDGVIANTLPFILANSIEAARIMGIEIAIDETKVRKLKKMEFEELGIAIGIPKERKNDFLALMLELSAKNDTEIFPGICDIFEELSSCNLCINTGNSKKTVRVFLEKYNIDRYIKLILDKEEGNKVEKIKNAMDVMKIPNNNTYMIGDAISDIEAAKQSKVHSIAVKWGNQDFDMLVDSKPEYLIDNAMEIVRIITTAS